jgi:hypothetical protein
VVGGPDHPEVAPVASFVVPVSLTVPQRVLADRTGYETTQTIPSFGVSRNTVVIPEGTSLVKVTLEVPAIKTGARGAVAPGEACSGVELMALLGDNVTKPFADRPSARVSNCTDLGRPQNDPAKRRIVYSTLAPKAGLWEVHVFGQYLYASSNFTLKVDYVNSTPSAKEIRGGLAVLSGDLGWKVKDASFPATPSAAESSFELNGLFASTDAKIAQDEHLILKGLRHYPASAKAVTVTTGNSPGNDIDLGVLECAGTAKDADDASCKIIKTSGGSTADETVTFKPQEGRLYAVRVDGYTISGEGKFTSTEKVQLEAEKGELALSGAAPDFKIQYAFPTDHIATSVLLHLPEFVAGDSAVVGAITIRSEDRSVLAVVPVTILSK